MKNLGYPPYERTGNLSPVDNVKQIHLIGSQLKGEFRQAKPNLSTLFPYNFLYGWVITHRKYYIPSGMFVKRKMVDIIPNGIDGEMDKKTIGERIRLIRKLLGLTQKEMGEKIGRSWKTINRWEAGEREIPDTALKLISQVFGVSYEWLKEGKGEMWERKVLVKELKERTEELLESFTQIPVVWRSRTGYMEVAGWRLVSNETILKGGQLAVQVKGDSMEPSLRDGDLVVFKLYTGDGSDIPSGKIVIVRDRNGELLVRRLVRIEGVMMLVPDNPKYPPLQPSADLQIVGVAVEAIKRMEL